MPINELCGQEGDEKFDYKGFQKLLYPYSVPTIWVLKIAGFRDIIFSGNNRAGTRVGRAEMWHGIPAREDTAKMAVPLRDNKTKDLL